MAVSLVNEDHVAILTLDNAPVNALSLPLRTQLLCKIQEAIAAPSTKAIVLIGAGRTFPAGADISEFSGKDFLKGPFLNDIVPVV